jgi:hypothetical protein
MKDYILKRFSELTVGNLKIGQIVASNTYSLYLNSKYLKSMLLLLLLQVHQAQQQQFTQSQLRYLLSAYRVGMLAMETLARRVHDDRPQAKYARNPPYGEDVKWLLRVARKLG